MTTIATVKVLIFCALVGKSYLLSSVGEVTLISDMPHDESYFTQGLVSYKDKIYESSGEYGKSCINIIDPSTGTTINRMYISDEYFSEGITILNNKIYMLTWREETMLVFNTTDLQLLGRRRYIGEGWGVTHNETCLMVSDGSSLITFYELPGDLNHSHLQKIRHIRVVDPTTHREIRFINELQYVNGYIYANVWYVDVILKIDPVSGRVLRKYDCRSLYPLSQRTDQADSFNGIAFNTTDNSFLVTGKLWPRYYRVRLDDMPIITENEKNIDLSTHQTIYSSRDSSL